mmetsp:Transcript_5713/g.22406  ORF Transcript_5713/g.22406 Transcript_5713/m.22406 type:complete len:301 (+) Transcript_5713:1007-1909(+)
MQSFRCLFSRTGRSGTRLLLKPAEFQCRWRSRGQRKHSRRRLRYCASRHPLHPMRLQVRCLSKKDRVEPLSKRKWKRAPLLLRWEKPRLPCRRRNPPKHLRKGSWSRLRRTTLRLPKEVEAPRATVRRRRIRRIERGKHGPPTRLKDISTRMPTLLRCMFSRKALSACLKRCFGLQEGSRSSTELRAAKAFRSAPTKTSTPSAGADANLLEAGLIGKVHKTPMRRRRLVADCEGHRGQKLTSMSTTPPRSVEGGMASCARSASSRKLPTVEGARVRNQIRNCGRRTPKKLRMRRQRSFPK